MKPIRRLSLVLATLVLLAATAPPVFAAGNGTTETTLPAESQSSSDGATTLVANCLGCIAGWGLWENANTIRAKRASYTDEVLTFIHVHWAFIKPDPDSCSNMYDGPYANTGTKEQSNTSSDQIKDSNYSQGGQHHWTNAGAHQWKDDGVTWGAGSDGGTDICKDFGF